MTKKEFIETIIVITILLTRGQYRSIQKIKNRCTVFSSQSTQKEQINNRKVVPERWLLQEEEDLVVHKVLLRKDLVVYKIQLSGNCSKFQQY